MIAAAMVAMLMQAGPAQQAASLANPSPAPGASAPWPTGDPGKWVTDADYPLDAFHTGKHGIVGFQLVISPQGRVDSCAITTSSGTPSLDEKTCELLQARAHFRPARDEKGNRVTGAWGSRVKWVVPTSLPAAAAR